MVRWLWTLVLYVLFSLSSQAQELSLTEVLGSIDARHPLLDAARLERPLAEGELQTAQGAFDRTWRTRATGVPWGGYPSARVDSTVELPTALGGTNFFAGYRWGTDTFAEYDGKLETNPLGELRAGAVVPLWRNGPVDRRRASLARARLGVELAELVTAERRIELNRLAAVRYWDWVAAGRKLALARDMLKAAQDRDTGIAARVSSGDLPAFEQLDNQRAILQRRQQVVQAERVLVQTALELSLYFRDGDGQPVMAEATRLPSALPLPTPAAPVGPREIELAVRRRPEPARARLQGGQAEIERDLSLNQREPALDLSIAASQDLGAATYDVAKKRSAFELEAALTFELPIDRNTADGRALTAQAQIDRANAQARFAADRVAMELRDAHSAIAASVDRHRIASEELSVARKLELGERDRFMLGDSSLLVVNLREQAALEAAVREVDASVDYLRARAAFEAASAVHSGRDG